VEWRNKQPILMTIFLGANDASLPDGESKGQYVPLEEYEQNLREMIQELKQGFPLCEYILITPPPVDNKRISITSRTNDNTGKYAKTCIKLANELHIPSIDFWTSMQDKKEELLVDGLHFNTKGNLAAHKLILQSIYDSYPHLTPEALPSEF